MLFSSMTFLFVFMPLVITVYGLSKKEIRNYVLLVASIVFYAWGEPRYLAIMIITILVNYVGAIEMARFANRKKRKLILAATILTDLGFLIYFKYFNFMVENLNNWLELEFDYIDVIMPIGISFYTFQAMSYLIDVYRREVKAQKDIYKLALYIVLFPQLVAGPIVRYEDVADEIKSRRHTLEQLANGLRRFIIGLSKKLMIADVCGSVVTLIYSAKSSALDGRTAWLAAVCYLIQIYFDFSGYSDMAVGLGKMFGFELLENFNYPYISQSITEFWRRWHISLSSWLKDYLYISLGGNRKGKIRTYMNLMITMLLGGLWHGASISFILWGALHGIALAAHKFIMGHFSSFKALGCEMKPWRRVLGVLITFHVVCFGWILFRATSMKAVGEMLSQIFTNFHPEVFMQFVSGYKGVFALMVIGYVLHFMPKRSEDVLREIVTRSPLLIQAAILAIAIFIVVQFKSAGVQPFIYFQF